MTYQYPMIRISTFGKFVVERLSTVPGQETASPQYTRVEDEEWGGRNHGRNLLKLLVCSDCRRAPRDVLLEMLWPDAEKRHADRYLNSAAWVLRRVLRTPGGSSLLSTLRPGNDLTIYELADQEQLWVDADAFLDLLAEAEQAEREGHDPLPWLEKAQELAHGEFLVEDLYHVWADQLRQSVNAARHRCLHWLADLYEQRGLPGRAETLLYTALKKDPADEDVLYRLMRVLASQGRAREALACYERTKRVLLREQQVQPLARTRELAEQIRNESVVIEHRTISTATSTITPSLFSESSTGGVLTPSSFMPAIPMETGVVDYATWFGAKIAYLNDKIDQWMKQAISYDQLQAMLDQEISMFDEVKPQDDSQAYTLSRRQALVAIAALPVALLSSIQQGQASALMIEELLSRCAASITAGWHLLKGSELYTVERMLSTYLPALVTLTQQSSKYQRTAANLVTQGYRLRGIVALHQNDLRAREMCCQQALYYSEIAEHPSLLVSALISLASTFYYSQDPTKAALIYQKALTYKKEIPPLQLARLYAELAVVCAQMRREQEALAYLDLAHNLFPEHPENDPSFLYAEFTPSSMYLEEGLTFLALTQYYPDREYGQKAWDVFARVEVPQPKSIVPERIRFEIINHQAETALALKNQELFRTYLEKGIRGANTLSSKQRRREAVETYKQARVVWSNDSRIKELADLFFMNE